MTKNKSHKEKEHKNPGRVIRDTDNSVQTI